MVVLSARAVNRATLARQLLVERADVSVVEAVGGWRGCRGRRPSIRTSGCGRGWMAFEDEQLTAAARERQVVRATMFRGTLHLLTAEDYLRFRSTLARCSRRG